VESSWLAISLSIFSIIAFAQLAAPKGNVPPEEPLQSLGDDGSRMLSIDAETYEVISPDGDQEKVAYLNTPQLIWQRYEAVWAITAPEDYNAQHPLTKEQQEDAAKILPPGLGVKEAEARRTPEEREADRKALESILNFRNP